MIGAAPASIDCKDGVFLGSLFNQSTCERERVPRPFIVVTLNSPGRERTETWRRPDSDPWDGNRRPRLLPRRGNGEVLTMKVRVSTVPAVLCDGRFRAFCFPPLFRPPRCEHRCIHSSPFPRLNINCLRWLRIRVSPEEEPFPSPKSGRSVVAVRLASGIPHPTVDPSREAVGTTFSF